MNHCIEFIKTAIDKQLVRVVPAFHPMTAGKWKWMNGWSFVLCCYDSPTFLFDGTSNTQKHRFCEV